MKNLLACLFVICVLMQPSWIFAGHLKAIRDLPAWTSFIEIERSRADCGQLMILEYENNKVRWYQYFLLAKVSNRFPNPFLTVRFDRVSGEFELWLDKDRDSHPDEYYSRKPDLETNVYPADVFRDKYPTLCDAVK